MAWKKAVSVLAPNWDKTSQKTVEGVLVDKREHVGQFDSSVFTIEQKGGQNIAVWAKGRLEDTLRPMAIGTLVRITWKGQVKTKGGRLANDYEVEYDSDTTMDEMARVAEEVFAKK